MHCGHWAELALLAQPCNPLLSVTSVTFQALDADGRSVCPGVPMGNSGFACCGSNPSAGAHRALLCVRHLRRTDVLLLWQITSQAATAHECAGGSKG